jgi:tetratricopeptide (TPR) repeat protein
VVALAGDGAQALEAGRQPPTAAHEWLGRHEEAVTCLQESLTIRRELGARHGQANSLTNLGAVHERLGEHDEAIARLQEGLTMYQELDGPYGQAAALHHLGDTLRAVAATSKHGRPGKRPWRSARRSSYQKPTRSTPNSPPCHPRILSQPTAHSRLGHSRFAT